MNLKMFKSESAVSPVIGIILMLGLTILSISSMLIYSVPTLGGLEDMAKAQKVEQAFTVFDSRTSKVALGESPIQTTYVSLMGGTINVNGDQDAYNESKIVIVTVDISDPSNDNFMLGDNRYKWKSWEPYVGVSGFDEFNCSLGSIEYSLNDRIIAYEGGGVWSKYPTGSTIMISPPEFHYNGETLTLPLMKINGRSGVSGTGDVGVSISSNNMPLVLFPNTTMANNRINPLEADKVIIYIKSEYYDAWANYANSQTYTSATVDVA
ncbi:MAG: type IV pilin N-terminal domain-containing protein, partial [Methanosarcinaceae archaeon]|nr:type IV pilin N-terminal domain-containing protein [Methanosarcinaceae archaeon]